MQGCNKQAADAARRRLDMLAKPPGSLGGLEEMAIRLAGITGQVQTTLPSRRVVVMAADNGVVAEGVASAPQSVTAMMTMNIADYVTGVGVLARCYGAQVEVIDLGVAAELDHPGVRNCKLRMGTGNIAKGPAMTPDQLLAAVETGIAAAARARAEGVNVVGVGEMGIGNTTTSSAVLACLLGLEMNQLEQVCGRGAGLSDQAYRHKVEVIRQAIACNQPDGADPLDVLCKVGGLDLAAMTGLYLGAAMQRLPVVIDGFISVVAALCAVRLCPAAADFMFASHKSFERGYQLAADALGLTPCLALDMRLGEGSGCPILFSVLDGACAIIRDMATFGQGNIDDEYLEKVKDVSF